MTRRFNPALLAMLAAAGEYGKAYTTVPLQTNPEKSPHLIADEESALQHPNAKHRKRLGLPKPQHVPTPKGKRYRRIRVQKSTP